MKPNRKGLSRYTFSLLTIVVTMFIASVSPSDGAVLYKSYLVKYDRGWDILCDPYVVQKDDWVYKIFRQKGEISANDFSEFISIFKRLNPHIKNIDRIRPSQNILIPLKKIEPSTFPKQSSGLVTIPFVTISKLSDLISNYANTHLVNRGDTISKLIADRFGPYGTKSYHEGIQLFKTINPEVTNLNYIYVGEKIKLPDAALRNQAWYQSLFDKDGRIKKELTATESAMSTAKMPTAPTSVAPQPGDPIAETALILEGKLLNSGVYFLPRKGQADFELDLSKYPVLEMKDGTRYVFVNKSDASKDDLSLLQSVWKKVEIVDIEKDTTIDTIIGSVLKDSPKDGAPKEVAFSDYGMEVLVTAKWIKSSPPEEDGTVRHTCVSFIQDVSQKTPDTILRYLDQHHVVIKDILEENGASGTPVDTASTTPFVLPDVVTLTPVDRKVFVRELVEALGHRYSKNVTITFPYAGIQVQALSNLVSTDNGREFLIDFGELYGDAIQEIQKTGLEIVQVRHDQDMSTLIHQLLEATGTTFVSNPVFYAAKRATNFNTKMTIKGNLITEPDGSRSLISEIPLHNSVLQFLNEDNIRVILAGLQG